MAVDERIYEPRDQFPIGMRVLAVDDDPTCLMLLKTQLRRCQYHVTTTNQAITALNLLRENKNKFDLVISEVHLPDMDGFKLLELVEHEMGLPVIMMSSYGNTELAKKAINLGASYHFLKPVRIEELKNIWQHVIRIKKFDSKVQNNSDKSHQEAGDREGGEESTEMGNSYQDEECKENGHDNEDQTVQNKPPYSWTVEMHQKFVAAVNQLGIDKAEPTKILELMNDDKLTSENVASHLQMNWADLLTCVQGRQFGVMILQKNLELQ